MSPAKVKMIEALRAAADAQRAYADALELDDAGELLGIAAPFAMPMVQALAGPPKLAKCHPGLNDADVRAAATRRQTEYRARQKASRVTSLPVTTDVTPVTVTGVTPSVTGDTSPSVTVTSLPSKTAEKRNIGDMSRDVTPLAPACLSLSLSLSDLGEEKKIEKEKEEGESEREGTSGDVTPVTVTGVTPASLPTKAKRTRKPRAPSIKTPAPTLDDLEGIAALKAFLKVSEHDEPCFTSLIRNANKHSWRYACWRAAWLDFRERSIGWGNHTPEPVVYKWPAQEQLPMKVTTPPIANQTLLDADDLLEKLRGPKPNYDPLPVTEQGAMASTPTNEPNPGFTDIHFEGMTEEEAFAKIIIEKSSCMTKSSFKADAEALGAGNPPINMATLVAMKTRQGGPAQEVFSSGYEDALNGTR